MLASLTLSDVMDPVDLYRAHGSHRVQAVDIMWQRPEATRSKYRGVKDISIVTLARTYGVLMDGDLGGHHE